MITIIIIKKKGDSIMKRINIIYWSGTGNTEMMANAIFKGANVNQNNVKLINVEKATKEDVINADIIALGCPSMGAEVLEDEYMEPFVDSLKDVNFEGKTVALFGSYDWGDGEWMRDWVERMKGYGANVIAEGLIIRLNPDDEGIGECKNLGNILAGC